MACARVMRGFHGERGQVALGQVAHRLRLAQRVKESDEGGAGLDLLKQVGREFRIVAGAADHQNDVGFAQQGGAVGDDGCAVLFVFGIGVQRGCAGAGLDGDFEAGLGERIDSRGDQRDARLTGIDFGGYYDSHSRSRQRFLIWELRSEAANRRITVVAKWAAESRCPGTVVSDVTAEMRRMAACDSSSSFSLRL